MIVSGCILNFGGRVGQRTLSRTHGRERMYGAQMGVASGWVGLSLRQVVDFGGRVRGVVNGLCHGLTDGNGCTARRWESLRGGWACLLRQAQHNACGGFWVSAGVSVGWSTDSATDSWTGTDGRRANGSRFGLGGLVCFDRLSTTPAADSGFRRARLCALVDFDVK